MTKYKVSPPSRHSPNQLAFSWWMCHVVLQSSYLSIFSLAILHLRFSVDVRERSCIWHWCILFICDETFRFFRSGFSLVLSDSCIVILSSSEESALLSWRKLIWICMVSIIYLLVYVVFYSLVCIATCPVCFGVNALTQCHNRTEFDLCCCFFFATIHAPLFVLMPNKNTQAEVISKCPFHTILMDSI